MWRHKISHVIDGGCQKGKGKGDFQFWNTANRRWNYAWLNQWGQHKLFHFSRALPQVSKCWDSPSLIRTSSPMHFHKQKSAELSKLSVRKQVKPWGSICNNNNKKKSNQKSIKWPPFHLSITMSCNRHNTCDTPITSERKRLELRTQAYFSETFFH